VPDPLLRSGEALPCRHGVSERSQVLLEARVTMQAMRTLERVRRPVGLVALGLAVVVSGCASRQAALSAPEGDDSAG